MKSNMWFAAGPNLSGAEEPHPALQSEQGLGEVLAQREEGGGKGKELEFITDLAGYLLPEENLASNSREPSFNHDCV